MFSRSPRLLHQRTNLPLRRKLQQLEEMPRARRKSSLKFSPAPSLSRKSSASLACTSTRSLASVATWQFVLSMSHASLRSLLTQPLSTTSTLKIDSGSKMMRRNPLLPSKLKKTEKMLIKPSIQPIFQPTAVGRRSSPSPSRPRRSSLWFA